MAIDFAEGSGSAVPAVKAVAPKVHGRWLGIVAGILVLSLIGSGVYWFTSRQPSAPREIKLRQLTFNSAENAVKSGAISPDGKYLAYIDGKGIHIRLLETSETQVVPEPTGVKLNWEICQWFPDSTGFLVNGHPASQNRGEWSSLTTSIWIVSVPASWSAVSNRTRRRDGTTLRHAPSVRVSRSTYRTAFLHLAMLPPISNRGARYSTRQTGPEQFPPLESPPK